METYFPTGDDKKSVYARLIDSDDTLDIDVETILTLLMTVKIM